MSDDPVQYGNVTSSYFWDDGSGINGDTGAPASGEPMQKGMAASPSWPLGTEGYVEYNGKKADFFVGDRGPGDPAENCDILLDLDGKTFAELTGGSWDSSSYTVSNGQGHIDVEYYITEWGDGDGTPGAPSPMSGSETCDEAVSPVPASAKDDGEEKQKKSEDAASKESGDDGQEAESEGEGSEAAESSEDSGDSEKSQDGQNAEKDTGGGDQSGAQQADGSKSEGDQSPAAPGDGGGGGDGLNAETAANDTSGFSLAGEDLPATSGLLALAILPALLAAFLFARWRPAAAGGSGRHRTPSLLTAEGWREAAQRFRGRGKGNSFWDDVQ